MRIPNPVTLCEGSGVTLPLISVPQPAAAAGGLRSAPERSRVDFRPRYWCVELLTFWFALMLAATSFGTRAESTNNPANTNAPANHSSPSRAESPPRKLDESAFRLVAERNIFNAERSGGRVVLATRRATRVESFTLVGTMAYEKGVFAFFESPSADYAKVVKTGGVIAGHKIADVLANAVKLEADGKIIDLPIGASMRREDEGAWRPGEGVAGSGGSSYVSSRSSRNDRERNDDASRPRRSESESDRGNGSDSKVSNATGSASAADQSEILKRLMERREKESQ